jgi:hypothetical protein
MTGVTIVMLAVGLGCGWADYRRTDSQPRYDVALFVPTTADNVVVDENGLGVKYDVRETYPASNYVESIEAFYGPPWLKRDDLVLFPGRRSSEFEGGWVQYYDGAASVFMRPVNYQHPNGDVVTIVIRYRVPEDSPPTLGTLAVVQLVLTRAS